MNAMNSSSSSSDSKRSGQASSSTDPIGRTPWRRRSSSAGTCSAVPHRGDGSALLVLMTAPPLTRRRLTRVLNERQPQRTPVKFCHAAQDRGGLAIEVSWLMWSRAAAAGRGRRLGRRSAAGTATGYARSSVTGYMRDGDDHQDHEIRRPPRSAAHSTPESRRSENRQARVGCRVRFAGCDRYRLWGIADHGSIVASTASFRIGRMFEDLLLAA